MIWRTYSYVISNKMNKTVIVSVDRQARHNRFHKSLRVQKKMMAHDEKNECQIGDYVQIVETRPLSKQKCWRVEKRLKESVEEG